MILIAKVGFWTRCSPNRLNSNSSKRDYERSVRLSAERWKSKAWNMVGQDVQFELKKDVCVASPWRRRESLVRSWMDEDETGSLAQSRQADDVGRQRGVQVTCTSRNG